MSDEISRILLIEDNPGDVHLVHECLHLRGIAYELTHCETVEDALRLISAYGTNGHPSPALMLLDYNLPRGEARTVLQACARNPALAQMRKAVLTSSVAPKDKQEALQYGADAFVYKAADLDGFLNDVGGKIAELLGKA